MYTVSAGLNLVANSSGSGVSGLYGLTGVVSGANVFLYATSSTLNDLDTTYLYGFQDVLASTTKPGTSFNVLATAPSDSNFKGIALAPTLPAGSATILSKPLGLTLTTAGTGCVPGTYVTPVTLIWTPGSSCQLTTAASQTYGTSTYQFSRWQDGTTGTTDAVTAPATSAVYTATFADTTATSVTSASPANAMVGDATTLTATVVDQATSGSSPTGNVTFSTTVNGMAYTAGTAPVTNGVAALNYNVAYAGSNTIKATFTPTDSTSFTTSADTAGQVIAVTPAPLQADGGYTSSMAQGTTTTLTLIIGYPGSVAPTGAITFQVNGSTAGLGSPTCAYKTKHLNCGYAYTGMLPPGNYSISFSQAADSNYTATSGTNTLTVTPAPVPSIQRGGSVSGAGAVRGAKPESGSVRAD